VAIAVREHIGQPTVQGSQPALRARDIVKRFRSSGKDTRAVDGVSLSVARGEIYALLGANGSGKSTLIRCFSTLLEADEGAVTVFGLDIREDELAVKRLINRVSVEASFFKKLSAMENLVYAGRLYGVPAADARVRSREILVRLGIAVNRHDEPLEKLSRGMQQKVAIARALLTSPILLLLDEPTTGLDPRSKLDVQTFIEELRDTHDATIVLTTHDLAEADRLCDRIAIINDGRIVVEDTPEALRAKVAKEHGQEPSMESVFMTYTGKSLDEDIEDDDENENDE